jgi:predicted phosphodiesterase
MKILFISDIHANYEALISLDQDIKSADYTICLGDIIVYHCNVNRVIEYLRENKIICICCFSPR